MVKKSEIVKAVIVRTSKSFFREGGTRIKFDDNAVVIINADNSPKGTLCLIFYLVFFSIFLYFFRFLSF